MNEIYKRYDRGALSVVYVKNEHGRIGALVLPRERADDVDERALREREIEPLVQLYVRGDRLPSGYANGATMCGSGSTDAMSFVHQYEDGDAIVTELSDGRGREAVHTLILDKSVRAVETYAELKNASQGDICVEMISSGTLGMLSPFLSGEQTDSLEIMTARSFWSSEGRMATASAEDEALEVSWQRSGVRVKKIGQTGSMPVRGFFPFMAVRDVKSDVTWAFEAAVASSWQIEARRRDTGLSVGGGLADYDFGHWCKTLAPGESFRTPSAYMTAAVGGVNEASSRILDIHRKKMPKTLDELPVMFNEYCTTWGSPSHENLSKLTDALRGRGFEYLVIDAGWFRDRDHGWWETVGDWNVDEADLFPHGMGAVTAMIRDAGMTPGIWFEPEVCASASRLHDKEQMLLHRNGFVIDTGSRRFLDMRRDDVRRYLRERVVGMIKKYGFGYVKIDYNDCIGIGCDGAESLGEGLRQNIEASRDFFRELRESCPGIVMENCASGGHRLTPSMMELFDMASFSDAHECVYIPIIAANLHRLILPAQSQIWAVLHGSDDMRRIHYSMVNTFLGVMCLSGDVYSLDGEKWRLVGDDIAFYKRVRGIIRDGESKLYRHGVTSYRDPHGWQAVVRTCGDKALAVIHAFGGDHDKIGVPVGDYTISDVCEYGAHGASVVDGVLTVRMEHDFDAVAVLLKKA